MRRRNGIPGTMSVSRLFWVLTGTAVMSSVAVALPHDNGGWLAKLADRNHALNAPADPAATNAGSGVVAVAAAAEGSNGLEGTWRATGTFNSGGSDKALFSFGGGRDNEGVVVHSDNLFFVPVPSCLSSQGVWKKTGDRSFIATDEAFCFDSTSDFAPAGTIRFRTSVTVNDRGTQFSGRLHIDAFDVDGNLVFSDDGTVQGVRMQAVAPPAP